MISILLWLSYLAVKVVEKGKTKGELLAVMSAVGKPE